jgi:quercetin dioxygenase-like cupin family protein
MKSTRIFAALLLATVLLVSTRKADAQEGTSPKEPQWTPATLFPPGALLAVVSGDPARPGQTTAELSLPDGYRVPRHFHPMGERLEVKQGTLLVGMGERFDVRQTDTLRAGATAFAPAGVHHYWVARGPTVVALTFDGPYTITYVNAYEAPRSATFPYQY